MVYAPTRAARGRRPTLSLTLASSGPLLLGVAVAGSVVLLALMLLCLARRISGGLVEPLSGTPAAILSLTLIATAAIARLGGLLSWLLTPKRLDRRVAWSLFVLPGLACFVTALAVTVPSAGPAADAWLFVPLALAEAFSLSAGAWIVRHGDRAGRRLSVANLLAPRSIHPRPVSVPASIQAERLAGDVTQRLVRRRLPDGLEVYQGSLRITFAAGQRTEVLHVAFCPPFETTPQWTASVLEGPALTIKQVQVYPYGARVEVRLNQASRQPTQSVITFQAREVREGGRVPT